MRRLSNAAERRVMLIHLTYGNTRNYKKKLTKVIKSEKEEPFVCLCVAGMMTYIQSIGLNI